MLGSAADAEDALQDALLRAWRGLPGFEGRSSLRAWLYRIATNVCLKLIERRPKRLLPPEHGPASEPHRDPDPPETETVWLEPYPDDGVADGRATPEARYEQRESVELAFVAALQHLPARQRAVLLLRDVLGFAPAEIAAQLDASPAAVYSALQRAHAAVDERLPARSQQATLRALGDSGLRAVAERYVRAWENGDVAALAALLTADATFAMPPRPNWYRGRGVRRRVPRLAPAGAARRLAARPRGGQRAARLRLLPARRGARHRGRHARRPRRRHFRDDVPFPGRVPALRPAHVRWIGGGRRVSTRMTTSPPRRTSAWVLALAAAGSCLAALDTLVVTTALPTLRADLGASIDELEWTVNGLQPQLRRAADDRGGARRPARPPAHVRRRARPLRGLLRGLRPRADDRLADRGARRAGRRCGARRARSRSRS